MTRTEYMKAVYDTDLDPVSKAILVYLGFRKNWKEGTMAFPSAAKVAADTGYSVATVKRKMPELRAKGYLSDTGQRKGRGVIVYDLTDPTGITVSPTGITVIPQEHQSDTAEVSERYTEQVREPEREQVQEQVHVSPTASAAVDIEEIFKLKEVPSSTEETTTSLNYKETPPALTNFERARVLAKSVYTTEHELQARRERILGRIK